MKTSGKMNVKISPRVCGLCAKCCQGWVKTFVLDNDIDVGRPCPYTADNHCTIHTTRPEDPCRVFFCGWAEAGSQLPDWMHPSQSSVIVLTGRSSWRKQPVDVLVSAGRDPDEKILEWFQLNSKKNLRPFIYQQHELWFGFGPVEFQEYVAAKAKKGEALWT